MTGRGSEPPSALVEVSTLVNERLFRRAYGDRLNPSSLDLRVNSLLQGVVEDIRAATRCDVPRYRRQYTEVGLLMDDELRLEIKRAWGALTFCGPVGGILQLGMIQAFKAAKSREIAPPIDLLEVSDAEV